MKTMGTGRFDTGSTTGAGIVRTLALAAGLALCVATDIWAAGLEVRGDVTAAPAAAGWPGDFRFQIVNDGASTLTRIRIHAADGAAIDCAANTAGGRGFTAGGELAAGDRVVCSGRAPAGSRMRSSGLVVSAIDAQGVAWQRHIGFAPAGAPATPDQGIVVLIGGAVHNDGNANGLLEAGESIDYHYTVMNLGSLDLSSLAVEDLVGPASCALTALPVNASMACTRNYLVTAADQSAGLVFNDVQITGQDANAQPVQGGDVLLTLNLAGSAGIRAFKSPILLDDADASGFASVGDLLRYTFVVKNSNAQTLTLVELVEPDPTRIDTPIVCAANTLGGQAYSGNGTGTLVSTDTILCTADYTVRASDAAIGQALNLVDASGTAQIGGRITGTAASAVVIPSDAALAISKSEPTGTAAVGGTLTYTVTATNIGDVTLTNLVVNDPMLTPDTAVCASVPPGGTCVLVGDYVVTIDDAAIGEVVNTAVADSDQAGPVDDTVTTPIAPLPPAALSVTKTANVGSVAPGGTVIYTITVANNGGQAATDVLVTDPLPPGIASFEWTCAGASCPNAAGTGAIAELIASLPAGDQVVYTVTAVLTANAPASILNVVSADTASPVLCTPDDTPPPCRAQVPVGVPQPRVPVPVDSGWMLMLMAGLLALVAGAAMRRTL